jgi:hypothetical protein
LNHSIFFPNLIRSSAQRGLAVSLGPVSELERAQPIGWTVTKTTAAA